MNSEDSERYHSSDSKNYTSKKQKKEPSSAKSLCSAIEMDNNNLRQRICHLRDENSTLVTQNHELLQNLEKMTWELSKAQRKIRSQEVSIAERSQSGSLTSLKARIDSLEREKTVLEKKLQEHENLCDVLKKQLDANSCDHFDNKGNMDVMNKELKLQKELRRRAEVQHEIALEALQVTQDQLGKLKERTFERIEQTEHQAEEVKVWLTKTQRDAKRRVSLEDQLTEANGKLVDLEKENVGMRTQLDALKGREVSEINLRTDLTQLKQVLMQKENEMEELVAERKLLHTDLLESGRRCETLRDANSRLKVELSTAQNQVTSDVSRTTQLEMQVRKLKTELKEREKISQEENKLEEVMKELIKSREDLEDMKKFVGDVTRREAEMESQVERLKTETSSWRQKCDEANQKSHVMEADNYTLRQEVSSLQKQVTKGNCTISSLEQRLHIREEHVSELADEVSARRQREARLEKEVVQLTSQVAQDKTTIQATKDELESVASSRKDLEHQCHSLSQDLGQITSERSAVSSQLKEASGALQEARSVFSEERERLELEVSASEERCTRWRSRVEDELEPALRRWQMETEQLRGQLQASQLQVSNLEGELSVQSNLNTKTLSDLEKRAGQSDQQMQLLQSELIACKSELQDLYSSQSWYDNELKAAKSKADDLESRLFESNRSAEERESELLSLNERCRQAEAGLVKASHLEETLNKATISLSHRESQLTVCRARIAELEVQVKRGSEETDEARRELEIERCTSRSSASDYSNTHTQLQICREELERERSERKIGEKCLRAEVASHEKRMKVGEEERDQVLRERKEKEERMRKVVEEKSILEGHLRASRTELTDVSRRLETRQSEVSNLEKRQRELESHLQRSQQSLIERGREVEQLEMHLKERSQELDRRVNQLAELEVGVDDRLSELHKTADNAKSREKEIRELMELQLKERESLQNKLAEKGRVIFEAEQKLKQLSKEIERRTRGKKELATEVKKVNDEKTKLSEELEKTKTESTRHQQELSVLLERLANKENERSRLAECLEESTQVIRTHGVEKQRLTNDINRLKIERGQFEAQMQSEVRHLQQQLEEAKLRYHEDLVRGKSTNEEALSAREKQIGDLNVTVQQLRSVLENQTAQLKARHQDAVKLDEKSRRLETALGNAEETIQVKNSTITRLESRLGDLSRQGKQNGRSSSFCSETTKSVEKDAGNSTNWKDDSKEWNSFCREENETGANFRDLLDRVNARMDARQLRETGPTGDSREGILTPDVHATDADCDDVDMDSETAAVAFRATEEKVAQLQNKLKSLSHGAERKLI